MRGGDERDFSPPELALLTALSPTVAQGLRRTVVLGEAPATEPDGPGLLLCTVGDDVVLDHATEAARKWLAAVDDGAAGELPYATASLVHAARHASTVRARIRTRRGDWITADAERLGPTLVSVIVEPTRRRELVALRADAFRLTGREREVAALAARGLSNPRIAEELYLSPYTVQDHLKQIFAKTGATGRAELAAPLYLV